ncbi:hypothetical protein FHW69_000161 [Luteibacter sp. Sphag1AF]|uniref:hypothetical protein n=1 Tax=Luteibacter sp. Sphag1AF TaxID=2587031 RepID=UPI00161BDD11|nr:hypothetical protein [Luteibacter sp. Sphag1AF]MBB3225571.1 hypothetical protein [Luteibacter sp. Sphag1AF]
MTSQHTADQLVANYLAELLTPAVVPQDTSVQVVAFEPWRKGGASELPVEDEHRYLLCQAAGIQLAIDTRDVVHMLPMPPLEPPVPPHPVCLGRWRHPGGEPFVADLASVVAPGMPGAAPTTLLLFADRRWAVACTVQDEPVSFDPDAVQWRTNTTSRPWLAGMAKEPKCAVVNTAALIEWLEREGCP